MLGDRVPYLLIIGPCRFYHIVKLVSVHDAQCVENIEEVFAELCFKRRHPGVVLRERVVHRLEKLKIFFVVGAYDTHIVLLDKVSEGRLLAQKLRAKGNAQMGVELDKAVGGAGLDR